jgi:hypothetical protein
MTAWHDAGFIFEGNRVFDRSVLLRRHSALDDCTGGARDRAKPERLLQNDALETVSKIIESEAIPTDEKLFFIYMAAGRAVNSDLYERGRTAAKKMQEKKNPSALERKLAAGIADTGVMDAAEYEREELGVQALAAEDRKGMKFQCSVCNKMYKTLLGCQKHGNDKHPPAMNFRAVEMNQQHGDDAGAVDLVQRNCMGRFTRAPRSAAPLSADPSSPVHDATHPPHVLPFNPEMLAILQAGTPPRSPPHVFPAKERKSRRRRCDICQGLYALGLYTEHIKKKKHVNALKKADDIFDEV